MERLHAVATCNCTRVLRAPPAAPGLFLARAQQFGRCARHTRRALLQSHVLCARRARETVRFAARPRRGTRAAPPLRVNPLPHPELVEIVPAVLGCLRGSKFPRVERQGLARCGICGKGCALTACCGICGKGCAPAARCGICGKGCALTACCGICGKGCAPAARCGICGKGCALTACCGICGKGCAPAARCCFVARHAHARIASRSALLGRSMSRVKGLRVSGFDSCNSSYDSIDALSNEWPSGHTTGSVMRSDVMGHKNACASSCCGFAVCFTVCFISSRVLSRTVKWWWNNLRCRKTSCGLCLGVRHADTPTWSGPRHAEFVQTVLRLTSAHTPALPIPSQGQFVKFIQVYPTTTKKHVNKSSSVAHETVFCDRRSADVKTTQDCRSFTCSGWMDGCADPQKRLPRVGTCLLRTHC